VREIGGGREGFYDVVAIDGSARRKRKNVNKEKADSRLAAGALALTRCCFSRLRI
jgi:hypothetical protein